LNGYFDNNVPDEFFSLMALYSARNIIASVPWSLSFGEEELKTAFDNIKKVNESYDGFNTYIPNWYIAPCMM
jgi:aminoglycoside phosphotransferase (APT) family kinase protein